MILDAIVIWDQIISALVWLLNHYYDWIGSWGWSIVLLTFTIRLAMLPLTIRQFRSMAAMQIVQPKVKQLQNRYKGKSSREDKQKMQQELMQLYKEHNVNPFGSCLPLLIQAPVFIALNAVLRFHIHPAGDQAFLGINNIFVKLNELTPVGRVHADRAVRRVDARLDAAVLVRDGSPAEVHAGRDADRVRAVRPELHDRGHDLLDHVQLLDDRAAGDDQAHHGPSLPAMTSPQSRFTLGDIVSLARPQGRATIGGGHLIVTEGEQRHEREIASPEDQRGVLKEVFGLEV